MIIFKKAHNVKIVSVAIGVVFLLSSTLYSSPALRVPVNKIDSKRNIKAVNNSFINTYLEDKPLSVKNALEYLNDGRVKDILVLNKKNVEDSLFLPREFVRIRTERIKAGKTKIFKLKKLYKGKSYVMVDEDFFKEEIASEDQMAIKDSWDTSIGIWLKKGPDEFYNGIKVLPVDESKKTEILEFAKKEVRRRIIERQDSFMPFTESCAWSVLFDILSEIYRDCIAMADQSEHKAILSVNPYLDPFFHVKKYSDKQAVKRLKSEIKDIIDLKDLEGSLRRAVTSSALANAIDMFKGPLNKQEKKEVVKLVDDSKTITKKLMDAKNVAICVDNAGEIYNDLILAHILTIMGKNVTVYARDKFYAMTDVTEKEVDAYIKTYDSVFKKVFSDNDIKTLGGCLEEKQLELTTDPFTSSGRGFSSKEGKSFVKKLDEKGIDFGLFKGMLWAFKFQDSRKVEWDDKVKNPWPMDMAFLHMGKAPHVIYDSKRKPDALKNNLIIRYVEHESFFKRYNLSKDLAAVLETEAQRKCYDLYKRSCSKIKPELLELFVARNKKIMGLKDAIEIIKEMQRWMKKHPTGPIPVIFCTGNTPWIAYMFMVAILGESWENPEMRKFLETNGIDPDFKPDMKRVVGFPMDGTLFQKREAYYAFSNILNNMFDAIGILKKNRRFFYGDLIMTKDYKKSRKISDAEFEKLLKSVQEDGLQLEYPDEKTGVANITAPYGSIQHRCLTAILKNAEKLDNELRRMGGAMITTSGIGPAVKKLGNGHIGFNDLLTKSAHMLKAYIAPACFYVRAAHGPEDKDQIRGTFIKKDGKIIPTMGIITFSLKSLFYRQDKDNPENSGSVIVIAEGQKGPSLKNGIEKKYDPEIPMTYLSKLNSPVKIITEPFCAEFLTVGQYPWWFRQYNSWSEKDVRKFFARLAILRGKKIKDLTEDDFLKTHIGDVASTEVKAIKEDNFKTLTKDKSWEDLKKEVIRYIENSRQRPKRPKWKVVTTKLGKKLRLIKRKTRLFVGPHLDDVILGMKERLKAACDAGDDVHVFILTKGFHAVDDEYTLNILKHWKKWDESKIKKLTLFSDNGFTRYTKLNDIKFKRMEKKLLKRLIKICEEKKHVQDRHDYNPWQHISDGEKDVRAELLFIRVNRDVFKGKLTTKERVGALVDFLDKAMQNRPHHGNRDLSKIEDIQTVIRIHEEMAADMACRVKYENIHLPVDVSFYVSGGARAGTAMDEDFDRFEQFCRKLKPDEINFNSERFTDHKAHSITEMMVLITAMKLKEEGIIPNIKLVGYAGVWERIVSYLADIGLMLSEEEMRSLKKLFEGFFVSQNPPPGVNTNADKIELFAEMVEKNYKESFEETRLLLGEDSVNSEYPYQANYIIIDLDDKDVVAEINKKMDEIVESRQALSDGGDKAWNGALPMPDLTKLEPEINALKESGLSLLDVVTIEELKEQLFESKREKHRLNAAEVLGWIGTQQTLNLLKKAAKAKETNKKKGPIINGSLYPHSCL